MEPKLPTPSSDAGGGMDREKMEGFARYYPEFSQIFMETELERKIYKSNEHAYRRHMERFIVEEMNQKLPKQLRFEISVLFKAKSFLSGDFCYAAKLVDDIFLLWMGDSISHGTGSSIVKDIINETVFQVFRRFNSIHEVNLPSFVQRVQNEFSSPRVLKRILAEDLSDIMPGNQVSSKMGIVIPVLFLQFEREASVTKVRLCNRGMPCVLHLKADRKTGRFERGFFYTKKDVMGYEGAYKDRIELVDHSGIPLILDKELFDAVSRRALARQPGKTDHRQVLFPIQEFRLGPGDLLVIPSDGVMECTDQAHQEYGVTRFIDDLIGAMEDPDLRSLPLADFKERYYYSRLRKYTVWNENYPITGNGIEDDMSILMLRHK